MLPYEKIIPSRDSEHLYHQTGSLKVTYTVKRHQANENNKLKQQQINYLSLK